MFAFEVEYLLGRVFAGSFDDRNEPEWPPHSGRLFSALAASYFESGASAAERAALEWLERCGAPLIRAGEAGVGSRTTAFVPTNYVGDGPPAMRVKQPRVFAGQGPSEATVHFIWPGAEPDQATRSALEVLASRTGYLGKAASLVRMCVTDSPPEANYFPDPKGRLVLRAPAPGRLRELEWLFQADQRPSPGAQVRYRRVDEDIETEPVDSAFGHMAVFAKKSGPGLPIEAALTLTDAVRTALMGAANNNGMVPGVIAGHSPEPHCAYVALPSAGSDRADGHLVGFAVVLPRDITPDDRRTVFVACAKLASNGLHISGFGDWELDIIDSAPLVRTLRSMTWARPARSWRTVTPILLDRFPKKNRATVDTILSTACERIGLPRPVEIEHGPYSPLEGVPPVPQFRLTRKRDERPRWGVHARFTFPVDVRGPVIVGAGRFFGLGLMRPDRTPGTESGLVQQ